MEQRSALDAWHIDDETQASGWHQASERNTSRATEALTSATHLDWLAVRQRYWPAQDPAPVSGVVCLAFGVGEAGMAWIDRLKRSSWFAGLAPGGADLAVSGGNPDGCWERPAGPLAQAETAETAIASLVASGNLPFAAMATIAIPAMAGADDLATVSALVAALREMRKARVSGIKVVVTIAPGNARVDDAYARALQDRGAFVIRPGLDVAGDHIHHFVLRAAISPRPGRRLIGVDLADYLACWPAGACAHLHVVPARLEDAAWALRELSHPYTADVHRVGALNIHFHTDAGRPRDLLAKYDRFAERCRALFRVPDGRLVFTNGDRLDGRTGLADFLIVHDRSAGIVTSASVAEAAHRFRAADGNRADAVPAEP